jgi:hypothetical protein
VLSGSDASVGTAGVVGGADSDPVVIGEFASLAVSRSFAGDIAAIRLSDTALAPAEFLQVLATYIADVTPTNGASFLPPTTVAGFVVHSPTIGVTPSGIQVKLNGTDISGQLTITGSNAERTVTLPALEANQYYRMEITVTDQASNVIRETVEFNTFVNNLLFIEGEDYNFSGGQFIDNVILSSVPGPNNYLDRWGIEGIDYHQTNSPTTDQYRIGDQAGTVISGDVLRQAYIDAQASDPGVADYVARDFANSEWVNYTRTFPAGIPRLCAGGQDGHRADGHEPGRSDQRQHRLQPDPRPHRRVSRTAHPGDDHLRVPPADRRPWTGGCRFPERCHHAAVDHGFRHRRNVCELPPVCAGERNAEAFRGGPLARRGRGE